MADRSPEWMRQVAEKGGWEMSEKSARDFKDGMTSIEDSGKMGVWAELIAFFTLFSNMAMSPFLAVWTRFFETLSKFFDAGAAEAAGKYMELFFSPAIIKRMEEGSKMWHDITMAVWNTNQAVADMSLQLGYFSRDFSLMLTQFLTDTTNFGNELGINIVNAIKNGFKSALKSIDWADIIQDILEDSFD